LSIHDKAFEIDAFTDKLSGIKFRPTSWSRSELYEIRGSSGSGKSRFLESLCAESKPDGECNFEVLYFPRSSASILKKVSGPGWWTQLLQVTSRSTLQRPTVVLADEVLSEVPVEEAIRRLRDLHELVVSSNGLLIYVDHRFSMGKQVLVEEIAEGGLL
jgi:ABC-type molybdenum transport system ATPase subunit/photorepair protein PhrA